MKNIYERKGYVQEVSMVRGVDLDELEERVKSHVRYLQRLGYEIENVSGVSLVGEELVCMILFKGYEKPKWLRFR